MKNTLIATVLLATASLAPAATVTLSAGFGAGLTPETVPAFVAIGSYVGFDPTGQPLTTLVNEFDVFASGTISGKLSGNYTGTDAQFNNADIYILIGNGTAAGDSGNVAIFKTNQNFPVDVTVAGGQVISTANTDFIE